MALTLQLPNLSPPRQQEMPGSSTQLTHNPVRILIGPPIDNWFKSEPWSILATDKKASAHEIAQSTASAKRPGNLNRRSMSYRSQFEDLTHSGAGPAANVFSESRSYISNIESNLNRSSYSTSTAIDPPNDFPRQCRALVRLELAREWHGPPGSYRESQLQSVERKLFPMREYGLVLYHNRLELTESLNLVDLIVRFTPTTKLAVFSPVDGSIAISQEHPNETFTSVYIFVFPTPTLARSWYMSLHRVMLSVRPIPCHVTVSVPELDTKIQVLISSDKMNVWSVREAVLSGLEGEEAWEATLRRWREDKSAGICWKHLDRLEWIIHEQDKLHPADLVVTPQLIEGTHELQIRTLDHHPQATEPLAIEGYLIFRGYREKDPQVEPQSCRSLPSGRLQKGRPYYLATFRHQLAYVNANRFSKRLRGTRQPADCIPYTFIEPCDRPGFDGHEQHWVNRQDPNTHSDLDFWRHVDGFIDFREVVSIAPLGTSDPIFEIELCGFRWLRLEAWNTESMQEWITRLAQLHAHWRVQLQQDARQLVTYARLNAARLGEEGHDSLEPENSRMLANPLLWRICLPKHCFPVLNSGVLFVKEAQHASFTKLHVVLTLDALHLFEPSVSTYFADGECDGECEDFSPVDLNRLPSPHKLLHPRLRSRGGFSIPLQNCFAYSGYSLDLVDPEGGDPNPRVFPDQLIALDTELDRSFGVWQSNLAYLWTPTPPSSSWVSRWCTYVHRSLSCGHAWFWPWQWFRPRRGAQSRLIFQARSRSEMDHWVYTLDLAIDYWVQHRQWARSA